MYKKETSNIFVTKTFLPPIDEFNQYIKKIWESGYVTNNGPILKEFEFQLNKYLGTKNFQFVTNGTLALQIAIRSLEMEPGEIITTPFSYVATTSAIMWEGFDPIYADIDPKTLCISPLNIESLITTKTRAIVAVHVFGNTCDIEAIQKIAKKHNLKVIYDAAHSFGVTYKKRSIFEYGDISVTSFHATKLFHTIEGGGIFANNNRINNRIKLIKKFGHHQDDYQILGINAKSSELQAAMGLCNIKYINNIITDRKRAYEEYLKLLNGKFDVQQIVDPKNYNYSYFPVLFDSEALLLIALKKLKKINIYPRRYFYPSLNNLPYINPGQCCTISEDISKRILCLPLYYNIRNSTIVNTCKILQGLF